MMRLMPLCLLLATMPAAAQAPMVNLNDGGKPKVSIETELNKIGPKTTIPPEDKSFWAFLEDIADLFPTAPSGKPIQKENWSKTGPVAMGSADGKPEMLKVLPNNGLAVVVKDKDGKPVVNVPQNNVRVVDPNTGRPKVFTMDSAINGGATMAFSLLLDNSQSMEAVIGKVRDQGTAFLKSMGSQVQCRVSRFDIDHKVLSKGYVACDAAAKAITPQAMPGLGKGTHLVEGIMAELKALKANPADFKALIIITDGYDTTKGVARSILAQKKDPIYAYWIGPEKRDNILKPISDAFVSDLSNDQVVLGRMLKTIQDTYKGVKVVHVR